MLATLAVALTQRDAIERDGETFMEQQRIADQIVAHTYEQQLEAYRFLQRPDAKHLVAFRSRGARVYGQIRRYLFHALSSDARLRVERIKEAHEQFEVAAQRTFELSERGLAESARARLASMDARARELDAAVGSFLEVRSDERVAFRAASGALDRQLAVALIVIGVVLASLALLLARALRRQVLLPLDQLALAAQQLSAGDPLARVPSQPFVEFDAVASAFNSMADSVQSARDSMEAQNDELTQTLENLTQAQGELVQHEKLSAMGEMLAGLAHELNNPLAGILGMAEALHAELSASPHAGTRDAAREMAEPLEREALRARSLVRNLLTFARKPSGEHSAVQLSDAVATAVGLRSHAFALAGKRLEVQVPSTLYAVADAQRLEHSIINIMNNALDALIAGNGERLTITALEEEPGMLRLDFEDDGGGFRDAAAAFTPFYTTKEPGKGTGLGLSLVSKFVSEFGGSATASNRTSGGARISLRLRPAPTPHGDADAMPAASTRTLPTSARSLAQPHGPPAAVSPSTDGGLRRHPARVLVVDDEPTLRDVQRRLLMRAGYQVVLASNGAAAMEILQREHVDLVISDLRMPGAMDGRALLAWLATEHPELAERSLVVTGDVGGVIGELVLPSHRLINKPFPTSEYLAKVREALGERASSGRQEDRKTGSQ